MPRTSRIDIPETVYHVYTRANKGSLLFLDDLDRLQFMKFLKRTLLEYPCHLLAYALMSTHYHLQIKTMNDSLSKTMHLLNTLYAGWFNYRHGQFGHVFQNRFHSIVVEANNYLLNLSRYLHLNAVKAGMVILPEDYRWSSYRAYIGLEKNELIAPKLVLETLSEDETQQRSLYREFVMDGITRAPMLTDEVLRKTRILGSPEFVRRIQAKAGLLPMRVGAPAF